mmetsp:Transcript_28322/g.81913  ORF Transcript_28322/g.81913 Transcript_28322/m.81913 type:complete len:298 (-) Transcript_28322:664-1557(-)
MSYQGEDSEPPSKKQKFGEVSVPLFAFGGPMDDEATARRKLEKAGFNPDAPVDDTVWRDDEGNGGGHFFGVYITPMIYFCGIGDVKMCRYLLSRGASTTKMDEVEMVDDDAFWCPMYAAADSGNVDLCNLIFSNGAESDIRRINADGWAPFTCAACNGVDEAVRWLVLHGALCSDQNSELVEGLRIYPVPHDSSYTRKRRFRLTDNDIIQSCERLVEWAGDVIRSHSSLVVFLQGTLPPEPETDRQCNLHCLSGHPGLRKHIADFVGTEITKGKHLRILRSVKEVLPSYIKVEHEEE